MSNNSTSHGSANGTNDTGSSTTRTTTSRKLDQLTTTTSSTKDDLERIRENAILKKTSQAGIGRRLAKTRIDKDNGKDMERMNRLSTLWNKLEFEDKEGPDDEHDDDGDDYSSNLICNNITNRSTTSSSKSISQSLSQPTRARTVIFTDSGEILLNQPSTSIPIIKTLSCTIHINT